jgi:RNA polymerase sigma factor (TIGR02999 family)
MSEPSNPGEPETKTPGEVTLLFQRWRGGEEEARAELVTLLYHELRQLAGSQLRREHGHRTLQPTELVNEALARLLGSEVTPENRSHFFSLAARAMRRVLVDHARKRQAGKRFDPRERVDLEPEQAQSEEPDLDVLAVHHALERFAQIAPRPARLVELRYFGGLTNAEAAEVLDISLASVERDWRIARLWLRRKLSR